MKRFLLLAVAVLAFVGCNNAFEDEGNSRLALSELPTLMAGFEDTDTRTYVEDNFYLRWHEGDLISAFVGDTRNCKYQFEGKTGDNSGTFVSVESSLGSSEKLDRIYALYPYDKSATITTKGVISCSLSAIQTYATDSFAQNVNTMVSATSGINDGDIIFKNVGGYLKIRLYGEGTVKSIELRGNNGEKIAGNANITATYGGVPKIAMADDATESIMLDCGDGVELSADAENPTEFWVVVPPMVFSKGITISVTNAYDAVFEMSTSNKIVVERNIIQPMSAVEVEFEEVTKPANNEIWYTSTDGNIVTPYTSHVFGATIVSNTYEDGKGVITFGGAVTTIGYDAFYNCDSLTSVTIPDSVTTIGKFAFYDCDSLTSITIPDSVTMIGEWAFYSCGSLTSVTIGDSVTTIVDGAFFHCGSLTSVTIGDSVTTIGEEAFYGCVSLKSVTIPDSVTTIGGGAFAGCPLIKEFKGKFAEDNCRCLIVDNTIIAYAEASGTEYTIPNSVTTIGETVFCYCSSLTSVTIGDSVTTIGDSAFSWCSSLTSVTIPDSVTTIGNYAFSWCSSLTSVYCRATTPPSIGYDVFDYNANSRKIYVRTASVNDYKTADGWSDYADVITGFNF